MSDFISSYRSKIRHTATSIDNSILTLSHDIAVFNERLLNHHIDDQRKKYPSLLNSSLNNVQAPHLQTANPAMPSTPLTGRLSDLRHRIDRLSTAAMTIKPLGDDIEKIREDQLRIKNVAVWIAKIQNGVNLMPSYGVKRTTDQLSVKTSVPMRHNAIDWSSSEMMDPRFYQTERNTNGMDGRGDHRIRDHLMRQDHRQDDGRDDRQDHRQDHRQDDRRDHRQDDRQDHRQDHRRDDRLYDRKEDERDMKGSVIKRYESRLLSDRDDYRNNRDLCSDNKNDKNNTLCSINEDFSLLESLGLSQETMDLLKSNK